MRVGEGVGGPGPGALPPTGAAARNWDVLVVGAGPAGSLAARQLALQGWSVLLVDKAAFPREKVCGCCLNARAIATLTRLGLGLRGARPLATLRLAAGKARAALPLSGGAAVSRAALDSALAAAAVEAGARFMPGTLARLDGDADSGRVALLGPAAASSIEPRAIVVADGLAGTFLSGADGFGPAVRHGSRIGASVTLDAAGVDPGTIEMACGRGGYVGMVRLEDGRLNVAAAMDPGALRTVGGPGPLAIEILRSAGLSPRPDLAEARWHGTPFLTRCRRVEFGRIVVVGDAAGYVEPFTGEGMAWALESAELAAPIVGAMLRGEVPAGSWARAHLRLIARGRRVCRAAAWLLRRPRLTRAAVAMISAAPGSAGPALRLIDRPRMVGGVGA